MSDLSSEKPQIIEHIHRSIAWTVHDTRWIPQSARFVAVGEYARGTGALQVFALSHGKLELLLEAEKKFGFKCAAFGGHAQSARILSTGDFDGHLMMWDLERTELPLFATKAHAKIINSIDAISGPGAPEVVTGSRDGCVRVWDFRQKDAPVASLEPGSAGDAVDCWAVAFGNASAATERCVIAGYDNGDVKLFDLRTNTLRWESNVGNGVCAVEFDRNNILMNKLVVAGLEGKFRVYDMRTFHPEKGYGNVVVRAHQASTIWAVRHLPQNRDVWMTCGGAGGLSLWKYSYPSERSVKDADGIAYGVAGTCEKLQEMSFGTQPVHCFDWSKDKEGLAVCGAFDQSIRVVLVTKLNKLF